MRFTKLLALILLSSPLIPGFAAPPASEVLPVIERVADWQLDHLTELYPAGRGTDDPRGWVQGVFWLGLTELADHSANPRYADALLRLGQSQEWKLGDRLYHADDHLVGQSYEWAYGRTHDAADLAPMKESFDKILAAPPEGSLAFTDASGKDRDCFRRWCWCDALFMAPATWIGLSRLTGDPRYLAFEDKEFWATVDALYDRKQHLFYRDSRFIAQPVFWSRGNGWVLAGLARILNVLPADHPSRPRYVALYKDFAKRVIELQKPDGSWPMSLLDRGPTPVESSGTGLFVYGLAWGAKAGLLDRKTAMPAIERGWQALVSAVQPDGRLGWVQQIGAAPGTATADNTQFYGNGAMILAGTAIMDLQN